MINHILYLAMEKLELVNEMVEVEFSSNKRMQSIPKCHTDISG